MTEIPDTWPPPISAAPIPMFPLPGVFLFPRQPLPLHVFEPRYRAMIEDSLDGPGRLALGTILKGEEETADYVPRVLPVAGLGEIARHDRLPDGRFMIILFGIGRVVLEEVESDAPYRQVKVSPLPEIAAVEGQAHRLDERLREAIQTRVPSEIELPDVVPIEALIDLLCSRLEVDSPVMERIFVEPDVARRAELALASHADAGPPKTGEDV
jgi:Lon protease-like protein